MSNWKSLNTVYIYDGSFEGLLTIVFDSFVSKTIPSDIVSDSFGINLFHHYQTIETVEEKASRIYHGIVENISHYTLHYVYHTFLSNSPTKEMDILQYILLGFQLKNKIDHSLANPLVFKVQQTSKRVSGEAHRLTGLVRFIQIGDNMYYSKIHPDNNIVELLGHHFVKRLPTQNFILHDQNRNIALLYNTKTYTIVDAKEMKINELCDEEKQYQALWKAFYRSIGIKERKNAKLRMQYMPKKYWQDLVEDL